VSNATDGDGERGGQPRGEGGAWSFDGQHQMIGERLRELRRGRRLTLRDLADRAGVSESFVSQLERGRTGTSLKSLQGLAAALGISIGDVFDSRADGKPRVLNEKDRVLISIGSLSKYRITPALAANLEVIAGIFEPHGTAGEEPYTHGDSEEVCLVLEGTLDAVIGDETFAIEAGDSLFYRSSTPHTFHARERGAEVIWIISPPSY
jgi:transcriptional regulator with XRE-family HTH domain